MTSSDVIACTIVARNYLAHARVFAASFLEHHPRGRVVVLLLDGRDDETDDEAPYETLGPRDVLSDDDFADMAMMYDVVEFATSVKPALLLKLLQSGLPVAYFDPDILVTAPLDDVFDQARGNGVVLTPHATSPLPRGGGRTETEDVILEAGVFNLGFIATGARGRPAMEWWHQRLRRECVIGPMHGRFVDQRWADLLPAYFPVIVNRDPGLNVAWWNLPTRTLLPLPNGGHSVNDHPLRFFHFSGYSPDRPWLLTTHQGPVPRVTLSERPDLLSLVDHYGDLLVRAGYNERKRIPYGLGSTASGMPIDQTMRQIFRSAVLAADRGDAVHPPSPFGLEEAEFLTWLASPDAPGAGFAPAGRYLHALWRDDPQLRTRFPDPHGTDSMKLVSWARGEGLDSGRVPRQLVGILSDPVIAAKSPVNATRGVRIITYEGNGATLDEIANRLSRLAADAGIPVDTIRPGAQQSLAPTGPIAPESPHAVNLYVVPPKSLGAAIHAMPRAMVDAPRNFAYVATLRDAEVAVEESVLRYLHGLWASTDEALGAISALNPLAASVTRVPIPARPPVPVGETGVGRVLAIVGREEDMDLHTLTRDLTRVARHAESRGHHMTIALLESDEPSLVTECVRWWGRHHADVLLIESVSFRDLPGLIGANDWIAQLAAAEPHPLVAIDAVAAGRPFTTTMANGHYDVVCANQSKASLAGPDDPPAASQPGADSGGTTRRVLAKAVDEAMAAASPGDTEAKTRPLRSGFVP